MERMVRVVCRLRARFPSMGRTPLSGLELDRFHRILELAFSDCVSGSLDRGPTEPKDDDRADHYNHMISPWTQSRERICLNPDHRILGRV